MNSSHGRARAARQLLICFLLLDGDSIVEASGGPHDYNSQLSGLGGGGGGINDDVVFSSLIFITLAGILLIACGCISMRGKEKKKSEEQPMQPLMSSSSTSQSAAAATDDCSICMMAAVNAAIITCGHTVMCYECAVRIKESGGDCPICRKKIDDVLKIFIV